METRTEVRKAIIRTLRELEEPIPAAKLYEKLERKGIKDEKLIRSETTELLAYGEIELTPLRRLTLKPDGKRISYLEDKVESLEKRIDALEKRK